MKKTVFAAVLALLMLVSSCKNTLDENTTFANETETNVETTVDITTEAITTEPETTVEITTEEITTEYITTEELTEEEMTEEITEEDTTDYENDPFYLEYKAAVEKTNEYNKLSILQLDTQKINMTFENGQKFDIIVSSNLSGNFIGRKTGKFKCYITNCVSTNFGGQYSEINNEMYADNNNIYYLNLSPAQWIVIDRADPDAAAFNALIEIQDLMSSTAMPNMFSKASYIDPDIGVSVYKAIKTKPSASAMNNIFGDIKSQFIPLFETLGAENTKFKIYDTEIIFCIDEDGSLFKSIAKMNMEISMTINDMKVEALAEITGEITANKNLEEDIIFPV